MIRAGILAAALLASSPASADVASGPPDTCPEGSVGVDFCHGPPTCRIAECSGDGDCEAGQVCAPADLCVREVCCSGRGCGMPETATFYDHVLGPCNAAGACDEMFSACETRRVCVPGTPAADAGPADEDAGPADEDAGASGDDAGPSGEDAGSGTDAGDGTDAGSMSSVDAGDEGGGTDGGCGCSALGGSAGGGVLGVLLLGLLVRRRS